MARVGVITFLHNHNYGSSLQAYALQRVIREMGHDCVHLDYDPDRREKVLNLIRTRNHPKLILEGLRKKQVLTDQAGARRKRELFSAFYRDHLRLTERCRNQKELRAQSRDREILICGSDQIWNPVWLNPAYFLTFAPKGTVKAAYAASLGIRRRPAEEKVRQIRRWTADFQNISVREEEGANLLKEMTGRQADVMPDPVCLLTAEEWSGLAGPPPAAEPYLLCYFIGENRQYWEKAEALRKETGCRVIVLPVTAESYAEADQRHYSLMDGAGPEAFLGAVQNAALLCTDSFHGLAFATIFGTETRVLRRYREEDPESKNSRIDHFLRRLDARPLTVQREEGLRWLRACLSETEKG